MVPLIIIVGPTAIGKSALGIELAKILNGEIISGDSVQIYKKLNIGSAKPSLQEQQSIPHHLIDFLNLNEPFNVAHFQKLADSLINDIKSRRKIPIIVGGTGLYIRSILDDFDFSRKGSQALKDKWLSFAENNGNKILHAKLAEYDPQSAKILHYNDTSRIIRALEVYELTGKPLSSQRSYKEKQYRPLHQSIIYVGLTAPRNILYERINSRCQHMIDDGLIEETRDIINQGYSHKLKPLQSIGYRHAIYYLKGRVTKDEMLRLLKRDTRHFAKRQLTWFKRDPRIDWYDITNFSLNEIANNIRILAEKFKLV